MARRKQTPDATVIDYRAAKASRARLELEYDDLVAAARSRYGSATSHTTIARFLRGDEHMRVTTIKALAALLGLQVRVTFEPINEDGEHVVGALGLSR